MLRIRLFGSLLELHQFLINIDVIYMKLAQFFLTKFDILVSTKEKTHQCEVYQPHIYVAPNHKSACLAKWLELSASNRERFSSADVIISVSI